MEHSWLKVLIRRDKILQGFHILKCTAKSLDRRRGNLGVPGCEQLVSVPTYLHPHEATTSLGLRRLLQPIHASSAQACGCAGGARREQEASVCSATFAAHLEPLREPYTDIRVPGAGQVVPAAPQVFQSSAATRVPGRPLGL